MKKVALFVLSASVIFQAGWSMTAFPAAAEDYPTEEEIIDTIWEDWWYGEPEDGTTFPEGSYEHHLITEWVEENYEDIKGDVSYAVYQYRQYYKDMTDEWSFKDDDNGNFYIADLDGNPIYHFNFMDGKWNMADENGNVVDSFMPFSTLEEDDNEPEQVEVDEEYTDNSDMPQAVQSVTTERGTRNINRSDDTSNSVHRVTGMIAEEVQAETAATTTTVSNKKEKSHSWLYGVGIVGGIIAIVAGSFILKKK